MNNTMNWIFRHAHLLVSVIIVLPTGIIYGSNSLLPQYLDIHPDTVDLSNMLKANMLLYLGMSAVWILGIWKSDYWKKATELNILFMLTLGTGRILSMLLDGLPTSGYIVGALAELSIGMYAVFQLRYQRQN